MQIYNMRYQDSVEDRLHDVLEDVRLTVALGKIDFTPFDLRERPYRLAQLC